MTHSAERWLSLGVDPPLGVLRHRKLEATQALLGDTIGFSDDDWRVPSLLPGWSRAHVAVHVARGADAMVRVIRELFAVQPQAMYPDAAARDADIEAGARRGGLDLQIDLDTSAGRLNAALDDVEDSGTRELVELWPDMVVPAPVIALARLSEVVVHHADLNTQYCLDVLDPEVAHWLAAWELFRAAGDARLPRVAVHGESGLEAVVGSGDAPVAEVWGTDAGLVRWLSGRGDATGLHGVEGLPFSIAAR